MQYIDFIKELPSVVLPETVIESVNWVVGFYGVDRTTVINDLSECLRRHKQTSRVISCQMRLIEVGLSE